MVGGGEAAHLEALGRLDEARQLRLWHRRLTLVHEVHDALHFPSANVLQNDDRVLARVVDEYLLEIGAERRQKRQFSFTQNVPRASPSATSVYTLSCLPAS